MYLIGLNTACEWVGVELIRKQMINTISFAIYHDLLRTTSSLSLSISLHLSYSPACFFVKLCNVTNQRLSLGFIWAYFGLGLGPAIICVILAGADIAGWVGISESPFRLIVIKMREANI
jgi:hypothetical protein